MTCSFLFLSFYGYTLFSGGKPTAIYAIVVETHEAITMKNIRVWIVFLFIALGIVAIRLSPQTQDGLHAFVSGYGLFAFILVLVLLSVIYRSFRGHNDKHASEIDDTPWWY